MFFFQFLEKKFSEMPLTVRVITYMTLLFLVVFLTIRPRFITGYMMYQKPNGTFGDYRGGDLRVRVGPNVVKVTTDEKGFWSFPVFSWYPKSMKLHVRGNGEEFWQMLHVPATKVWTGTEVVIVFDDQKERNRFYLAEQNKDAWYSPISSAQAGMIEFFADPIAKKMDSWSTSTIGYMGEGGFSGAKPPVAPDTPIVDVFDDELAAPISPAAPTRPTAPVVSPRPAMKVSITNDVRAIIAEELGLSLQDVTVRFPFSGKRGPSYIKKLSIIEALEKHFTVKIPDEHWQALQNPAEIATYIQDRLTLKKLPDISQQAQQALDSYDWPAVQQALPEQRPAFKPENRIDLDMFEQMITP